jgi:hypothetical protein
MASLQEDILAVIEMCRSAIAIPKKSRPDIDAPTIEGARKILIRLREYEPSDAALTTLRLNDTLSWWDLLHAMEAADKLLEDRLIRRHVYGQSDRRK